MDKSESLRDGRLKGKTSKTLALYLNNKKISKRFLLLIFLY